MRLRQLRLLLTLQATVTGMSTLGGRSCSPFRATQRRSSLPDAARRIGAWSAIPPVYYSKCHSVANRVCLEHPTELYLKHSSVLLCRSALGTFTTADLIDAVSPLGAAVSGGALAHTASVMTRRESHGSQYRFELMGQAPAVCAD